MKKIFIVVSVAVLLLVLSGCKLNPLPSLSSILPISKVANLPTFTLTVNGSNFIEDSRIFFNGIAKTTTYISSNQLTCEINPADIAAGPASLPVMVSNPSPGGGDSGIINFTVLGNHQFTSPLQISFTGMVFGHDIAVDNTGKIYVVWQYDHYFAGGDGKAYFTLSDDGGTIWTTGVSFYNGVNYPWHPVIAVDSTGNINVTGTFGGAAGRWLDIYFMRSTNSGSTWSTAIDLSGGVVAPDWSRFSRIALDSSGSINIIWQAWVAPTWEEDIFFIRSTNDGVTWDSLVNISNNASSNIASNTGGIAVDQSDNINVVWEDSSGAGYSIKFSRSTNNGANWSPAVTIDSSSSGAIIMMPCIAVDGSGNINVIWVNDDTGNDDVYFSQSVNSGDTWSSAVNITNDPDDSRGDIAVDGAGNINVVYYRTSGGVEFIRSTNNGASWSSPVVVSSSYHDADMALDTAGNVYLLLRHNNELYFSRSGV